MTPVLVPTTDVNSDEAVLVAWCRENRTRVEKGARVAEVETSKAVIEVDAPDDGFLLHDAAVGETVQLSAPIAHLFADTDALERFAREREARQREAAAAAADGVRATQPARLRAAELGVDLRAIPPVPLVTVKHVEAAAQTTAASAADEGDLPQPLATPAGAERLLLIGGAFGATQVLEILRGMPERRAVCILDDDRGLWGRTVGDVPIIGGTRRLAALFANGAFDAAIITIGTSIPVRVALRERCAALGVPLANAIDRTVAIGGDVTIGTGNVICAFCHFGTGTTVGDNNFISAFGSFDHHNVLGSEITTGPSCVTSGLVTIGNRVKMGMGVRIEPHVEIGDDAQIASGAVIVRSVPAAHAVKTKIVTTTVVPIRTARS